MKGVSGSSDATLATAELCELEKQIEKARRLLSHLEYVVDANVELGRPHSTLNAHQEHILTLLSTPTPVISGDQTIDLCEINAQLVEAALFMQAEGERTEQAHLRQSQFLNTFAHELRNPLTPIRNAAALLDHIAYDPMAVSEIKNVIERQVAHILRLLNDLLDLARVEAGKLVLDLRRIDLAQLVDETLKMYLPVFARREQKINKTLRPNVFVDADPDRFSQILSNLLDNATKYTPAHGIISVSVSVTETGAELKIADNGIGISADVLPNIFNLYLQDAAASAFNRNGLGIGLSVVQELIKAHGGKISAHSEGPGKGSEFTVTLPRVKLDASETKLATQANIPITSIRSSIFKNEDALTLLELQNQVADDQVEIADLKEKLNETKSELQLRGTNLRSVNEKLISSALCAQIEADETASKLKKIVAAMNADVLARSNQNRIEFLSRASHELRTPLNAILGFGQLMLRDDDDHRYLDHSQRERLEGIRRAGQQLLEMTDGILNTRSERLDNTLGAVELLDIIGATLTLLEEKRREQKVQWQWILAEPCSTWGNAAMLQRALHSVITYALQHSVAGSVVEGSLQQRLNNISILIGYQDCSDWPSINAPPRSELLAAKVLLESMQGTLNIRHPLLGVTTLQVTLKSYNAQAASGKPLQSFRRLRSQKSMSPHRVLYIEDNPVNAMVMTQIFAKQSQWEFSIATNGATGLELAASTDPSLIILDMQLGDMSGSQVFAALKSKNMLPPCGCIALSADALPEHIKAALDTGFTDYWTKPLDVKSVIEKLHVLLPI